MTYQVKVTTVTDLPVEIPIAGECFLHLDTAPGAFSEVQVHHLLSLSVDHLHILSGASVTISRLESSDIQFTGSPSCLIANGSLSVALDVLTATLEAPFESDANLCRLCDSTIAACAPEPGASALGGAALLALAARVHCRRRAVAWAPGGPRRNPSIR